MPDRVCMAAVAGAHGTAGEVRLVSFTDPPASLSRFEELYLEGGSTGLAVTYLRPWKKGWIVRFDGIDSREAAQALAGRRLDVPRAALDPVGEDDEYYIVDLVGLEARDPEGRRLGEVAEVANYGAGDLIELTLDRTVAGLGRMVLLPFSRALVPEVDLAGGRLTVDMETWLAQQANTRATER